LHVLESVSDRQSIVIMIGFIPITVQHINIISDNVEVNCRQLIQFPFYASLICILLPKILLNNNYNFIYS